MTLDAALGSTTGPDVITLAELIWPDELGEDTLRLCNRALAPDYRGVVFEGNQYLLADFDFSEIRHSTGSERIRGELSIGNLGDPATGGDAGYWQAFAARPRELNGTRVNRYVLPAGYDEDDIPREERWFVSGYTIDAKRIRFGLGSPFDALMLETPGVPLCSHRCLWASLGLYKRHPCNSVSTLPDCDGSLASCQKRFPAGAVLRFGPSFPLYAAGTRRRRG